MARKRAVTTAATFGDLLRQLRRRAGLTQGQLAKAVGFSVSQISRLEKDDRLPNLDLLIEQFLPALALENEPRLAQQLITLAAEARGEQAPVLASPQSTDDLARVAISDTEISTLPTLPIPLVGRDQDINAIGKRLVEAPGRLLTLIGPPGVGKTQLALAAGHKLSYLFADGVHVITLVNVTTPTQLPLAILAALGQSTAAKKLPERHLVEYLRRKELLLILDNFEQIVDAAPTVATLLAECPTLYILVTSQQPLRLRAEQRFPVAPLTLPAAVELFVQRAQAIDPAYSGDGKQVESITAICRRLDCLPLAIELITPQLELFSPTELLARLQDHHLDLLADGPRDLPAHHKTLRNALHRSYQFLQPAEQQLLRIMGVFAGGCTVEMLEAFLTIQSSHPQQPFAADSFLHLPLDLPTEVKHLPTVAFTRQDMQVPKGKTESRFGNELLPLIQKLMRKSLVQQQNDRLTLLATVRDYAVEQLAANGELAPLAAAHATYFLLFAQRAAAAMQTAEKKPWLEQLSAEHDNLRATLRWAIDTAPSVALDLIIALAEFWDIRGHDYEARDWIEQVLAAHPQQTLARAAVLCVAATFARRQADYDRAEQRINESLAIYRAEPPGVQTVTTAQQNGGLALALRQAGWLAYDRHDKATSIRYFEESLEIQRRLADQREIAETLLALVHLLIHQPEHAATVQAYLAESLAIYRRLAYREGIAHVLQQQGEVYVATGEYTTAATNFREVLTIWRALGAKLHVAWALALVGETAWLQQDLPTAATCFDEAYQLFVELGNKDGCAILLHHQGQVARRQGDLPNATIWYRDSMAMSFTLQNRHMMARCSAGLAAVALAQQESDRAVILLGAAQQLFEQLPPFLAPADEEEYRGYLIQVKTQAGQRATEWKRLWQQGQALTLAELARFAVESPLLPCIQ